VLHLLGITLLAAIAGRTQPARDNGGGGGSKGGGNKSPPSKEPPLSKMAVLALKVSVRLRLYCTADVLLL
jgi:hypothetical protein